MKVALVLGGGGARGLAHIGVIKYLSEKKFTPDLVVGCSMGAIIGGVYASGYSSKLIEDIGRELARDANRDVLKPSLSLTELYDSSRFERFLKRLVGKIRIEEMPIKFAANAYDVISQREVILDRGSLVSALRASASLPGVYETIHFQRENLTLMDGGVVDPIPIGIARRMGADFVIAVNVLERFPKGQIFASLPYFHRKKGILPFLGRALAFKRENVLNGLIAWFMASQGALVNYLLETQKPDILIEPDLRGISSILDFSKYDEIVHAGYKAAKEKLEGILENLRGDKGQRSQEILR
jgi:Predicted esterase of the alpha-beta hydrolase superfamily